MPFFFGGGDLVPDALAGDLPFELGKRQEDVKGETAHAAGGVERLGYRYERHAMGVEQLNQFGKIGKGTSKTVDLINKDHIDQSGLYVLKQLL